MTATPPSTAPTAPTDPTEALAFDIELLPQGLRFSAAADQTVLLSALAANQALPHACRNGTCRSCICRLHSGSVVYRMPWPGLSAEEKTEGLFLPCVAYPTAPLVMRLGEAPDSGQ